MGSAELDALQFTGAQKFIDSAPTDIEDVGGTLYGNGQSVIKVDEMSIPTFAHDDKNGRGLFFETVRTTRTGAVILVRCFFL
jgi:hypothetical protein